MGASNFHYKNICVVVGENYIDEETGETQVFDEWQVQDLKDWIHETLAQHPNFTWHDEYSHKHSLHSYPVTKLGEFEWCKYYNNYEVKLVAEVTLNAGYYEAGCLDYVLTWYYEGEETDKEGMYAFGGCDFGLNEGLNKIMTRNAVNWFEKTEKEAHTFLEAQLRQFGSEYKKIGTASNGETFYEKA